MASARAPKQHQLTKNETINSYESWRQNLLYILSLDSNFAPFLAPGFTWEKRTTASPTRGLIDDVDPVPEDRRKTAAQKVVQLEMMLGQIANYCTVISRNSIIKSSTSLDYVWQLIREHYGFQATGAHFLDLADIKLQPNEKPQDLYQRLVAFFEDNLMTVSSGIKHHGEPVGSDEDMTPSLENTVVLVWLQLIHPGLPSLVKQKYGSDLRHQSLASLKPEISLALTSLLDELHSIEDTKAFRSASGNLPGPRRPFPVGNPNRRKQIKACTLCKAAGRAYSSHYLSECKFLPDSDKRAIARSRLVQHLDEDEASECEDIEYPVEHITHDLPDQAYISRVRVVQSPILHTYYDHHTVRLTIDTGATTNMIKASLARAMGISIRKASQVACQADGVTPLNVVGEVHCVLNREGVSLVLDALVVEQLDVDVLAGQPFCVANDVAVRPAKCQIIIQDQDVVLYNSQAHKPASVRRTQAYILRSPTQTVLLPGEFVQLPTPKGTDSDCEWALEPRWDCPSNKNNKPEKAWPPAQEICSVGNTIRVTNATDHPITLKRNVG